MARGKSTSASAADLDDEVVERRHRLPLGGRGLEPLAEVDGLLHVDVDVEHEVRRRGLRLRHPPRHGLLQPREVLRGGLALAGLGVARHHRRRRRPPPPARPPPGRRLHRAGGLRAVALGGGLDVGLDDPPAGAGALGCASSSPSSRAIRRATGDAFVRPPLPPSDGSGARAGRLLRRLGRTPVAATLLALGGRGLRLGLAGLLLAALLRLGLRLLLGGGRAVAAAADLRDRLADGRGVALLGDDLQRPVWSASYVILALSVSISTSSSPRETSSPSDLSHEDRALLHRVGEARHRDVGCAAV